MEGHLRTAKRACERRALTNLRVQTEEQHRKTNESRARCTDPLRRANRGTTQGTKAKGTSEMHSLSGAPRDISVQQKKTSDRGALTFCGAQRVRQITKPKEDLARNGHAQTG